MHVDVRFGFSRTSAPVAPESTLKRCAQITEGGQNFQTSCPATNPYFHLDHAGAPERWCGKIQTLPYVHEIGSPHMIDPSRLLASAGRLYGGDLKALYGECMPVPEKNLTSLQGVERFKSGKRN